MDRLAVKYRRAFERERERERKKENELKGVGGRYTTKLNEEARNKDVLTAI